MARRKFYRRWWFLALMVLVVALIVLRILLPSIVLNYVNKTLDRAEGYDGHVEDIDIRLFRGAYVIDSVRIVKTDGDVPVPLFAARKIDISIEWRQIFNGNIVAELSFENPQINFVQGPTASEDQTGTGTDWRQIVKDLAPFQINRLVAHDGAIHYRDFHQDPQVNVYMNNIRVQANNLTNSENLSESLVSSVEMTGDVLEYAPFSLSIQLDPFAAPPEFDINAELETLNLTDLNDFLNAYVNADAESGTFELYTEAAAANGEFEGYVKPLLKNVDMVDLQKEKDEPIRLLWETAVDVFATIFQNQKEDQLGSKVSLRGHFENPNIDVISAILSFLTNAFIQALSPAVEGTIHYDPDSGKIIREKKVME